MSKQIELNELQGSRQWHEFRDHCVTTASNQTKKTPRIIQDVLGEKEESFSSISAQNGHEQEKNFFKVMNKDGHIERPSSIIPSFFSVIERNVTIQSIDDEKILETTHTFFPFSISPDGLDIENGIGYEVKAFEPNHFFEIQLQSRKTSILKEYRDELRKLCANNPNIIDEIKGFGPANFKNVVSGGPVSDLIWQKIESHFRLESPLKTGNFECEFENFLSITPDDKAVLDGETAIYKQCLSYFLLKGISIVRLILINPLGGEPIMVELQKEDFKDEIENLKMEIIERWITFLQDLKILGFL